VLAALSAFLGMFWSGAGQKEEGMTNVQLILSAAIALLFTLMLPALVRPSHLRYHIWRISRPWRVGILLRRLAWDTSGVVAITYSSPFAGNGTTTAPTAIQASQLPTQTAQVFFADTDTQAVIVHNWGLGGSFPSFLFPEIMYYKALGGASETSFGTDFTFGISNTNSVTMNKISVGVGSGGTWNVIMRRPYSPYF